MAFKIRSRFSRVPAVGNAGFTLALSLLLLINTQFANVPVLAQGAPADYSQSGNLEEYARYSEEGTRLFNSGQMTQAIEAFGKALAIAPAPSIPVVYNNLAVVHIKRGNYYHDKLRQDQNALSDFRHAYFYLETAWPEGMERKPLHEKNRQVARENLKIAYQNLRIPASDKAKHLDMAKQLQMQGKFYEAIVEYEQAWQMDRNDFVAAKALGNLFTIVNLPEKSKKYYTAAVGGDGKAGIGEDETLVHLGNAQYKTGEVDKAIATFDKALAINPNNMSALNMLEKIWKTEIQFNPASVLGHANLGGVYQKKKQYDLAFQQYNAAEHFADKDPRTPFDTKKLIRLNLATLFQEQKRYELALKGYDTVLQVEPNHLLANYYKATLLQETGNLDGALQAYNKVLSIDANYKPAQDKLLILIRQQKDPVKLATGLKQYGDRFARNATVQAQIGEEFHQRKDLVNAALFYQRAIQLDPKLASAWANLGAVYQAQGKDEESADAFQKALALDPNNSTFQELAQSASSSLGYKAYQTAIQLQQEGKAQESWSHFQKALATSDTADVRAAYGVSLQSAGRLDDAIAQYQKALSQDNQNADYAYYLGTAYHQKKDIAKAQAAYKQALGLNPNHQESQQALATIDLQVASADLEKGIEAYNRKNYPTALTLINQVLAKKKDDSMAYYYKGLVYDAQKKPSLAAQSYKEAIQYNPDFADAYYALAVALDSAKDASGARSAFEQFLTLSGSNEDDFVQYARDRLKALSSQ